MIGTEKACIPHVFLCGTKTVLQEVLETIGYVSRELKRRLPGIPVYPSLGSHDFVPAHSDPGPPLNSWLLNPLADMFASWLGPESLDMFKYAGYYEVLHELAAHCALLGLRGRHESRPSLSWSLTA